VPAITFVTCVSDPAEYSSCRASIGSLEPAGLKVLVDAVDNLGNRYSCPEALNLAWARAESGLLVFCHQDVIFPEEWLLRLRCAVSAVEATDPGWAVLGPMGRVGKRYYGHAMGPDGAASSFGPLPARVETLDEFCLVLPTSLSLRFDEKLGGYHLYGVDLCLQATESDRGCYAIDAPCRHNSRTLHRPPDYHRIKRKIQRKWMFRRTRIGRSVGTTCGRIRFGLFEGWL
jgi:hypothetical protein